MKLHSGQWNRLHGPLAAARQAVRKRKAAPGGVVLAYHDVEGSQASGLTVSANQLESHIRLLRRLGLQIVPITEFTDRFVAGEPVDDLAVLTFDDALVGVHHHALPVLDRLEAPATVFVVSDSLGQEPAWWPGSQRVMSSQELQDLAKRHSIGSHTRHHPSLLDTSSDQLVEELVGSRDDLRHLTNQPITTLAYPSGHYDQRIISATAAAGYRVAFTFLNGRIGKADGPFRLPRLTMGAHMSTARLSYHLLRPAASWPDHQLDQVGPTPP